MGRVFVCTDQHEEMLDGVFESPNGAVAKLNPDRTVSGEVRIISDKRSPNERCAKHQHPPALQPRHAEVCREVIWWKTHLPGIEVLLAKKDIKSAFYLVWVKVEKHGSSQPPGQGKGGV